MVRVKLYNVASSLALASRTWPQPKQPRSKATGSRAAKTRPKVSWEGMPPGRGRKARSQACLARPKAATSTQVSAPGAAEHRAHRHRDDVEQAVALAARDAGVGQVGEVGVEGAGDEGGGRISRVRDGWAGRHG